MEQQSLYKKGAFVALAALAALVLAALLFYKQRMLLCDASHILFQILNEKELQIQQYRFGAFITQSVPLAGAMLDLPLKLIMMAYSVSFNLFYFIIAAILVFRFKAYKLTILMGFYYLLIAYHTFFWPNNEVHQGIAWMFLFYALLLDAGKNKKSIFFSAGIIVILGSLAVFTHPLVIIPFVFLWGFLQLNKEDWPFAGKENAIISITAALVIAVKLIVSRYYSSYDSELMHGVSHFKPGDFFRAFVSPMAMSIAKETIRNFWIVPVLFIIGMRTIIQEKKFLLAGWVFVFCLGYFVAVCLTFKGYLAFYTESELMPAAILATAAFVFLSMKRMNAKTVLIVLILIFSCRLFYLRSASTVFTSRYHFINHTLLRMKENNISKLALTKEGDTVVSRLMLDWGLPAESILTSSLNGELPNRTIIIKTAEKIGESIPADKISVAGNYEKWSYSRLNKRYFNIDTNQSYRIMPYDSFVNKQNGFD